MSNDDLLTCPRCGAELEFIGIDDDDNQDWDYFSCPDCHYRLYSNADDLTIERFDDDPDSLWICGNG